VSASLPSDAGPRLPQGPRHDRRKRILRVTIMVASAWVFGVALPVNTPAQDANPPSAEDWLSTLGTVLGPTLTIAIRQGRDQVYPRGQGIPASIRHTLAPFFSRALLQKVRYSTEWQDTTAEGALYTLLLGTGADAVTLGDVIIFRDAQRAADPVLWAHELTHVEQYDRLGIAAFATQYLQRGWMLEQEATANASKIQWQLSP
jgi:hypothetical protein